MAQTASGRLRTGRRELKKIEKLRRIRDAARELFISHGYDNTTMRQIAVRSGVGLGTIFSYADNKRDLLFLIATDRLDDMVNRAAISVHGDAALMENLLGIFRLHYKLFAEQPLLSKFILREMSFYDSGEQARRMLVIRQKLIRVLTDVVEEAIRRGEISRAEDPEFIAWTVFGLYQADLRKWIASDNLHLRTGMKHLRRSLSLLIRGLHVAN